MSVVGTLTVDLLANTATFTADLGKAGNSLDELGKKAAHAGDGIDVSMRAARGSLMLIGDEFGVHLPREIRTMIAEIPGIGLALEAILPIMGVVFAAKMIYEFIEANEKAARELGEAWNKVGVTTNDIFAHIGDKLLEVGKKSDELAGNHIAALQKQLELVDRQTMAEVIGELDKMGKEADNVFTKMQGNWFMQLMMGRADTGPAKAELNEMIAEIDRLKGTGADPGNATRALLGTDIDAVGEEITKLEGQLKSFQAQKEAAENAGNMAVALSINGQVRGAAQRLELEKQNLATLEQMRDVAAATVNVGEGTKTNDKTEEAQKETERQEKLYEAQQRGLEQRRRAEEQYAKQTTATKAKAAKEAEQIAEEEMHATTAVMEGQAKIQQALANETLKQASAMDALRFAADEDSIRHRLSLNQISDKQALDLEIQVSQERLKVELARLDQESAALMQHGTLDALKLAEA